MRKRTRLKLIRGGKPQFNGTDKRIVYGVKCTWWGRVGSAAFTKGQIPICPNCKGAMMEVPSIDHFWTAVSWFEEGTHGVPKPHPGYKQFMEWLHHRCFNNILVATTMYQTSTGVKIVLDPEEFNFTQEETEQNELQSDHDSGKSGG